ncbi:MAG: FAD-binding oxidoreductase, partial [Clostridiales Family XIII bacterium]|nr:FAD-binding oxidoreductase [Clostridiales Family XIII bacterium]
GYFDGTMISNTYAKKFRQNGGVVHTAAKVTELLKTGDRITGLKTEGGDRHDFDCIVDCTGPWSRFTGMMAGLDVPIRHTKAEAFFLVPPNKKLEYVFPVLKFPAYYALRAGDNIFICKSHLSMDLSNPMHAGNWDPDQIPLTGGTDEYFIEFLFEQLETTMPGLLESGLASSWLSYRAETEDFLPILGETPVEGYFVASGYGGNGIIEAPAASRDLAKFIMTGEKTLLLEEWAFTRLVKA